MVIIVVAVPFEPVDHDHFLFAVVDDGRQTTAVSGNRNRPRCRRTLLFARATTRHLPPAFAVTSRLPSG